MNKKTLIISSWAPPMIGGPQNLYNLFSCISDQYAIYTSRTMIEEAINGGTTGVWLPCPYYSFEGGIIDPSIDSTVKLSAQKSVTSLTGFFKIIQIIPFIGHRLANLGSFLFGVLRNLKTGKWTIKETSPKLLLGISDTGLALLTTWLLSKKTKRPYALYLFDLYSGTLLNWPYSWVAKLFERSIMTNASLVILTNEITEEYYKKRYGDSIHTAVVHNSIFDRKSLNDYNPKPPLTIVFTGHIYWAQEQAVTNLIKAMDKLTDLPLTLKLYAPKAPDSIKQAIRGKSNILLSAASPDEMPKVQSEATLLFLPLAWHTKAPDIIATATPGKFTDYLASGRPMLIHAPDYAYISQYSKKHKLGLVVDENNVELLSKTIRDYINNPQIGKEYVKNSLDIFYQNHDAKKNAMKLNEFLKVL